MRLKNEASRERARLAELSGAPVHALLKLVGKDGADLGQGVIAVLPPQQRAHESLASLADCAIAVDGEHERPFSAPLTVQGEIKGVLTGVVALKWTRVV